MKNSTRIIGIGLFAPTIASVVCTVPAFATDRVITREGSMTDMIAFNNGVYTGTGTVSGTTGAIYSTNNVINKLNIGSGKDVQIFGSKYVIVDENIVDLSTGAVISTYDQLALQAKQAVVSKLINNKDYSVSSPRDLTTFEPVGQQSFGGAWFIYKARLANNRSESKEGSERYGLYNYESGQLIELGKNGSLTTFSTAKNKLVEVSSFDEKYADLLTELKSAEFLAEDSDYLYFRCTVTVYDLDSNKSSSHYYVAKLSKTGSVQNGFTVPSSYNLYELSPSYYSDDEDIKEGKSIIFDKDNKFAAKNGELTVVINDKNLLTIQKIDLDRSKLTIADKKNNTETEQDTKFKLATLRNRGELSLNSTAGVSIDVSGNIWVVSSGRVYSTRDGSLKEELVCDYAIDNISAYDSNNIVLWSSKSSDYSTYSAVSNTVPTSDGKALQNLTSEVNSSHAQDSPEVIATYNPTGITNDKFTSPIDGKVYYADSKGAKIVNDWFEYKNGKNSKKSSWFFVDTQGQLVKDTFKQINGKQYYFNSAGVMQTGWVTVNGTKYYFNSDGTMAHGWTQVSKNWYYFDSTGLFKTGWYKDTNGKWYYFSDSGVMQKNKKIDGYKLGKDGAMI